MRTARMLVLTLVAATGLADPAAGATLAPSARVFGDVSDRTGPPPLDAFSANSDDTGVQDLQGSADDPGGTANSGADVSFRVSTVVGGERLTADGSASARSGLPVRAAESTSNVTTSFTVTEPSSFARRAR